MPLASAPAHDTPSYARPRRTGRPLFVTRSAYRTWRDATAPLRRSDAPSNMRHYITPARFQSTRCICFRKMQRASSPRVAGRFRFDHPSGRRVQKPTTSRLLRTAARQLFRDDFIWDKAAPLTGRTRRRICGKGDDAKACDPARRRCRSTLSSNRSAVCWPR